MSVGDLMAKKSQIECMFEYLDRLAMTLHENEAIAYLDGIDEALNYLLDDRLQHPYDASIEAMFKETKTSISTVSFDRESIRKGVQLALLKGFKHARITNAQMTPDSMGIFLAYLLKKLYVEKQPETMLDPLIGTANLIATLHNHSEQAFVVCGIDDDDQMCRLSRNLLDALEIDHQVYLQDTLSFQGPQFDAIVTDFPTQNIYSNAPYLPYPAILHHLNHLKSHCFFIALIENNFFEQKDSGIFKERLAETAHLYGLIKLDEGLFKTHPKSILIMQKKANKEDKIDDFLLVNLPSFTDLDAFNETLNRIESWFIKKKENIQ